ncbi:hypothetical protein GCM10023212_41970 [Luteolibacter yonseiensis]
MAAKSLFECSFLEWREGERIGLLKGGGMSEGGGMTDPGASSVVLILLFFCAGLLLMVLGLIFQVFKRLVRIENRLSLRNGDFEGGSGAGAGSGVGAGAGAGAASGEQDGTGVEISPGGAFEAFLNEDASRRALTKREQSAAYRKWRQAKGMNWSNS